RARAPTSAKTKAAATETAATSSASANAPRNPTAALRAATIWPISATPATTPSVRARNESPPAAPCRPEGNAAMIVAMLGTSKKPSPKPAMKSASATTASGVGERQGLPLALDRLGSRREGPGEDDHGERHADVKHPAPAEGLDEDAGGKRAEKAEPHGPAQEAESATTKLRRRPGDRERRRGAVDQSSREALHDPRDEEPAEAGRRTAHDERDQAERDADAKHRDVTNAIPDRAARERGDRVGQHVTDDHPAHALGRHRERRGDRRERDVHHGVERHEERAGGGDPPRHSAYDDTTCPIPSAG